MDKWTAIKAKIGTKNDPSCHSLLVVQSDSKFTYQEPLRLLDLPFLYPSGDSILTLVWKWHRRHWQNTRNDRQQKDKFHELKKTIRRKLLQAFISSTTTRKNVPRWSLTRLKVMGTSPLAGPELLVRVIWIIFATLSTLATARGGFSAGAAREKSQTGARDNNRNDLHSRMRKRCPARLDKKNLSREISNSGVNRQEN